MTAMKKGLRVLFAVIALFGIMNCFVLEPALAAHQEISCTSDDGCDDCFLCCSFHHQLVPSTPVQFSPVSPVSAFIETAAITPIDAPSFSIFHPPLAL